LTVALEECVTLAAAAAAASATAAAEQLNRDPAAAPAQEATDQVKALMKMRSERHTRGITFVQQVLAQKHAEKVRKQEQNPFRKEHAK
jgi:hypothetical protein